MKKIVLSAFGPFGEYPLNSTELVAKRLDGLFLSGFKICSVLFEAQIPIENRGEKLIALAKALNAQAIISLGMASEKQGLCIEKLANNKISNLKYCPELEGVKVNEEFDYDESLELSLEQWDIPSFLRQCHDQDIPAFLSQEIGGFCCNHLAYQLQRANLKEGKDDQIPFVFMHTPCSPEAVRDIPMFTDLGKRTMSVQEISDGLEILLRNSSL